MPLWRTVMISTILVMVFVGFVGTAHANITVADYLSLRQQAQNGDIAAQSKWQYYVTGLMDGIQAVQAPTEASGGKVFFCIPEGLPVSPKFLDEFIQSAMQRLSDNDQLTQHISSPMAVLVAIELKRTFPCERD